MMKKTGTPVPVALPESLFFAVEGIDGAGKSRFCRELSERLGCTLTREPSLPGANVFADILAENRIDNKLSSVEQYYLFQLDRAHHAKEVVQPALQNGGVVLTDRSYMSTMVYQHASSDCGWGTWVDLVEKDVKRLSYPSPFWIVIDMDPGDSLKRLRETRGKLDDFETFEQLSRFQTAYRSLASMYKAVVIDGSLEVEDKISQLVEKCRDRSEAQARYLVDTLG